MDLQAIGQHYIENVITSDYYNSPTPVNEIELLFPDFRKLVFDLKDMYMQEHGTEPYIIETYRSNTLQLTYFNHHTSKIKTNGTHHYCLAVDLAAINDNGNVDYEILDYKWLRETAKELGLTSLNFEEAHKQYCTVEEQQAIRNAVSEAIKQFQSDNGLLVDGNVGLKTITKAKEIYGKQAEAIN